MCISHALCMYVPITHQYTSLHCLVPHAFYAIPILHILSFTSSTPCTIKYARTSCVINMHYTYSMRHGEVSVPFAFLQKRLHCCSTSLTNSLSNTLTHTHAHTGWKCDAVGSKHLYTLTGGEVINSLVFSPNR